MTISMDEAYKLRQAAGLYTHYTRVAYGEVTVETRKKKPIKTEKTTKKGQV